MNWHKKNFTYLFGHEQNRRLLKRSNFSKVLLYMLTFYIHSGSKFFISIKGNISEIITRIVFKGWYY